MPASWATTIDIGQRYSGTVAGIMNTLGNLGGAVSAVAIGYLATAYGWTVPFVVCSAFCGIAALLAMRIDPTRSAVEDLRAGTEGPSPAGLAAVTKFQIENSQS